MWDAQKLKSVWSVGCLGGFAYGLSISPLNPNKVAVAVGDKTIRVWHYNSKKNPFDTTLYWKGLQSKVTSVNYKLSVIIALML